MKKYNAGIVKHDTFSDALTGNTSEPLSFHTEYTQGNILLWLPVVRTPVTTAMKTTPHDLDLGAIHITILPTHLTLA